jgi:hypothetical protein
MKSTRQEVNKIIFTKKVPPLELKIANFTAPRRENRRTPFPLVAAPNLSTQKGRPSQLLFKRKFTSSLAPKQRALQT